VARKFGAARIFGGPHTNPGWTNFLGNPLPHIPNREPHDDEAW
jgi:hypothetical protein